MVAGAMTLAAVLFAFVLASEPQVPQTAAVAAQCEPARLYVVRVERVIDGDTYDVTASLGFDVSVRLAIRLHGLDTPERNTAEGKRAQTAAAALLASGAVTIRPTGDRTFARWVADVFVSGVSVAETLRQQGHAKGSRDARLEFGWHAW